MDPLVEQTLQAYAYVGDDPVNEGDPSGEFECDIPGYGSCLSLLQENTDGSLVNGFTIYRYFTAQVGLTSNEAAGIAGALVEESNGSPARIGNGVECIAVNTVPEFENAVNNEDAFGIAAWTSEQTSAYPYSSYGGLLALLNYAESRHVAGCSGALSDSYDSQFSCWESVATDIQVQLNFLWSQLAPVGVWHSNFLRFESDSATASAAGYSFDYHVINYGSSIPAHSATSAEDLASIFGGIQYAFSTC